jgi:hypothetical protein
LTEDEARNLYLVRAVEIEDRAEALLTGQDRQQASATALTGRDRGRSSPDAEERYLADRAKFAATRLTTRHPLAEKTLRYTSWPGWVNWAVPVIAFGLGLATNELGSGNRLNIVAFPLIGMFAWNLAVYGAIVAAPLASLVRPRRARRQRLGALLRRFRSSAQGSSSGPDSLSRSLMRFSAEWSAASRPITGFRIARTLHLGAALFCAGLLSGIYLRALGVEYRAGWESTFLGADAVHALVSMLLGPASALTNIPLPDQAQIAAIRWTGSVGRGANAAPWIHLYAATAALFVILPRLVLAAWNSARVLRLHRSFPVPGREDFYLRRLLRGARGGTSEVRVTPYAYTPGGDAKRRLAGLIEAALGEDVRVSFDATVDYGSEERWLEDAALSPSTDHHIMLFNLASTPEAEIHGAFVRGLIERLTVERNGTVPAVLLDESGYRQRLGLQSGVEERLRMRNAAWQAEISPAVPVTLNLNADAGDECVARLEAALLHDPSLEQAR